MKNKSQSQKFWSADAAQSLVRAIVKILGGFMVAKGVADQSSVDWRRSIPVRST